MASSMRALVVPPSLDSIRARIDLAPDFIRTTTLLVLKCPLPMEPQLLPSVISTARASRCSDSALRPPLVLNTEKTASPSMSSDLLEQSRLPSCPSWYSSTEASLLIPFVGCFKAYECTINRCFYSRKQSYLQRIEPRARFRTAKTEHHLRFNELPSCREFGVTNHPISDSFR